MFLGLSMKIFIVIRNGRRGDDKSNHGMERNYSPYLILASIMFKASFELR